MPIGAPGDEGLKLTGFDNLRLLADSYSILRAAIQVRKEEILGLEWDIMPTPDAAKAMRGNPDEFEDFVERRAEAVAFFRRPDKNYASFRGWLNAVLEEIFVTDALAIHIQPPRGGGKGVLGSDMAALVQIRREEHPAAAEQERRGAAAPEPGVPAVHVRGPPRRYDDDRAGDDLADIKGDMKAQYASDRLLYLPMNPRINTPYGFPPVERCLVPVMIGLMKQKFMLDFFQEGNIPGVFVEPNDPTVTPSQIADMQLNLNALAGEPAWKHKMLVLPGKATPMQPIALTDGMDEVITEQVCMALDVMPLELGVGPKAGALIGGGDPRRRRVHPRRP